MEIVNQPLSASQRKLATPETLSETYIVSPTIHRHLDYTQYNSDEVIAEITDMAHRMEIESDGDFSKTFGDYVSGTGHNPRDYWLRKMHGLEDVKKEPKQAAAINRLKERYERELPSGTVLYRTSGLVNDDEPELLDFAKDKSYRGEVVEFQSGTSTSYKGAPSWLGAGGVLYVIEGVDRGVPVGEAAERDENEVVLVSPYRTRVVHRDEDATIMMKDVCGSIKEHKFKAIVYLSVIE